MKTLRILCRFTSVLILIAGASSYALGEKRVEPAALPVAAEPAEATTAAVDISQMTDATGTATTTVDVISIPGDRIIEVINTVDNEEFYLKLSALSMEFEIDKEWFIAMRKELLKQTTQAETQAKGPIEEAYEKCKSGKPEELKSMLTKERMEAVPLYYICKKLEKGPEVCDNLKTLAPDTYKECINQTPMFWFKVVPVAVNPNTTEQDYQKTGQEICSTIPEARDRLSECVQHFVFSLQALKIILVDKDKSLCGGIASDDYKDYCKALFDQNLNFCTPQKQQNFFVCLQHLYGRTLAMARGDKSLISEARKTNVVDTLLAGHFISPTACGDFIGSSSALYCDVLKAQAIESVDLGKLPPSEDGNNSSESVAPKGNSSAPPKSKPR